MAGLAKELRDLKTHVEALKKENRFLLKRDPIVNRYQYNRRVKTLENKIKTLEKSELDWCRRFSQYLDVRSYINDCHARMRQSKYSFDEYRVREIIHVLKRLLP